MIAFLCSLWGGWPLNPIRVSAYLLFLVLRRYFYMPVGNTFFQFVCSFDKVHKVIVLGNIYGIVLSLSSISERKFGKLSRDAQVLMLFMWTNGRTVKKKVRSISGAIRILQSIPANKTP